ncbi:hypothetical protein ACQY0O_002230 [Thecaphora frezii]
MASPSLADATASEAAVQGSALLQQLLNAPTVSLRYSVATASSYSGIYHPNNILHNRPHDMSSRWSGSSQYAQPAGTTGNGGSGSNLPVGGSSTLAGTRSTSGSSPRRPASSAPGTSQAAVATPSSSVPSKQYIILKLDRPTVVKSITFGKYHKPHPCNLRDFKIYGSLSLESLLPPSGPANSRAMPAVKRLIRGGLRNDATPEKFELRWLEDVSAASGAGEPMLNPGPGEGELDRKSVSQVLVSSGNAIPFALQYIKIVPLAAHTPNYNFSVWHVALAGVNEPALVSRVLSDYDEYRESVTIRLVLKHLREHGHHTAFAALLQSSRLSEIAPAAGDGAVYSPVKRPFEHPLLTDLFDALVRHGSWNEVEACLDRAAHGDAAPSAASSVAQLGSVSAQNLAGSANWGSLTGQSMFSAYISRQMPRAVWHQLYPAEVGQQQSDRPIAPSGRGGHSMVFDSEKGIAYLFGGWDGQQDLCDLWAYHVHEGRWRLISADARLQGGPGPRSCHKMCLDEKSGSIYLLGRYIDYDGNAPRQHESPHPYGSSSPSNAASARSTRASFLPPVPFSGPPTRDVPMGQADASSQTGEGEAAALAATGGGGRHRRINQLGTEPSEGGDSRSNTPPSSSAGGHSPGRSSRPATGSRTPSRGSHAAASPLGREPDFFRFSTKWERWERLSGDTFADGGPKLIYDHGLVVDSQSQILYVFGGRIADPDPNKFEFSGMWRYDIIQRTWTFLFDDNTQSGGKILSRSGHSMLLDPGKSGLSGMSASQNRQIWILGGHRGASATNLADMWTYNLATGAVREISKDTGQNGPESGFTRRATIDPTAREISLFVGLIGSRGDKKKASAFWIYSIPWGTWKQVFRYEVGGEGAKAVATAGEPAFGETESRSADQFGERQGDADYDADEPPESGPLQALPVYGDDAEVEDDDMAIEGPADSWTPYSRSLSGAQPLASASSGTETPTVAAARRHPARTGAEKEPRPRYAAQLVFDDRNKVYYLHGGNPEDPDDRQLRLDDLWRLTLMRPTPGEVLRRAKFRVRQQRFLEMTRAIAAQGAGTSEATSLGLEALIYLQSEVGAVVDHSNEAESKLFRRLMTHLLNAQSAAASTPMAMADVDAGEAALVDPTLTGGPSQPGAAIASVIDVGMRLDRTAATPAKRGRTDLETEDEESARSPVSAYDSSTGDGDSEMLSISQVLPGRSKKATGGATAKGGDLGGDAAAASVQVGEAEGRPSRLYAERNRLFRSLMEYFDPELTEPRAEISNCIEASLGG